MRFLLKLYPKPWRERYGAELEALLEEAPADWVRLADLLKGALGMRLRYQSGWVIVLGCLAAGTLAGYLASFCITPVWQTTLALRIENGADPELLSKAVSTVMARQSLANIINDPSLDLYKRERRNTPLEDIVGRMRRDTHIRITPGQPTVLTLQFDYSDRNKAFEAANVLISKLSLAVQNPGRTTIFVVDVTPQQPQPTRPYRRVLTVAGVIAGSILGFLIRTRTSPSGPGLRPA